MDLLNFTFPIELEPNKAIAKLIDVLDLQNLQFMTVRKFEDLEPPPYIVDAVTMTGRPSFVNSRLKEMRDRIIEYFNEYANSLESIDTKIQVLSQTEILLTEKLFYWDLEFPELYDGPLKFDLIDLDNNLKVVVFTELVVSDAIKKEIVEHHNVRIAFFELLIKQISLLIKKAYYHNINYSIDDNTNFKSIDLLEVWIGLKEMGLLEGNKKNEVKIRKDFFNLFGLPEIQYNDKHNQIKTRQQPKFIFLEKMHTALKNAYEK